MARARDQFRQADVSFWGIVALVSVAVALLGANISAVLPDSVFAALHATRLGGASVNEMHTELAGLEDQQAQLRAANGQLVAQAEATARTTGLMQQRVSALEVSVPKLTEAVNSRPTVSFDPSIVTGSIGTPQKGFSGDAVAPTVSPGVARTAPQPAGSTADATPASIASQPMPAQLRPAPPSSLPIAPTPLAPISASGATSHPTPLAPASGTADIPARTEMTTTPASTATSADIIAEGAIAPTADAGPLPATTVASAAPTATPQGSVTAVGVAVGAPVPSSGALAAWQGLASKVGILLVGTSPLLADDPAGSAGKVLVAGPLPDVAAAARLCANIDRVGINCTPMPYVGSPLSPSTAAAD